MNLGTSPAGRAPPWDINVVVEIAVCGQAVASGPAAGPARRGFPLPAPYYPGNYGFVPGTRMADGEPCPVLVVGSVSVLPGAVLRSRPIGLVVLADGDGDGGEQARLLAVPRDRLHPLFAGTDSLSSLPAALLDQVVRFFSTVEEPEAATPLQVTRWGEADEAARLIEAAIASHLQDQEGGSRGARI
jgi:inorganic pyrophosphatase